MKRFKGSLGGGGRKQHCHLVDERENSLLFITLERQGMPRAGPHRGLHLEVGYQLAGTVGSLYGKWVGLAGFPWLSMDWLI